VVVLRDDAAAALRKLGVCAESISRFTPTVDKTLFADQPAARGRRIGYAGRIEESKGFFELPGVMAALSDLDVELECVGTAPVPTVGARAARAMSGLPAQLLGEMAPSDVAARMRTWKALVLPSYSEGCPIVVLEALSTGTAVVAVDGVLSPELARRDGVIITRREDLAVGVRAALARAAPVDGSWVTDHAEGGAVWDALYASLGSWSPRPRPSMRPAVGRFRRLRRRA
jgi:glycosyltransferase involved in cell wall biosynthesis